MEKLIKKLDKNLKLLETNYIDDIMEIHIEYDTEKISCCPSCGQPSRRRHSVYTRKIKDLPMQDYKVVLVIHVREFFCDNDDCTQKIFSEKYNFLGATGTRTKRLDEYLIEAAKSSSAIGAERMIRKKVADVSNDSILRIIKKNSADK